MKTEKTFIDAVEDLGVAVESLEKAKIAEALKRQSVILTDPLYLTLKPAELRDMHVDKQCAAETEAVQVCEANKRMRTTGYTVAEIAWKSEREMNTLEVAKLAKA